MAIYIERIELSNYRSCKKTNFKLNDRLSALIGVNGSGKSNLLSGILLLRKITRISRPHPGDEILLSGCKLKVWFRVDKKLARYEALIKYATNDRNVDEVVSASQKWNLKEITGQDAWVRFPLSTPHETFRHLEIPKKLSKAQHRLWLKRFTMLTGFDIPDNVPVEKFLAVIEAVFGFVAGTSYYSASQFTDPSRCPTSFEIENDRLSRRSPRAGSEHLQFMYDLYSAYKKGNGEFDEFISVIGTDGIGLIDNIEYDEIDVPSSVYEVVTGGRVIRREVRRLLVVPNFVIRNTRLSPNQLSEGTFKTLALVFYLITDKGRLLLLEEPEVCVHHGLLASIVEIIKTFSRKKQIVISTHSDFVVDALDPTSVFIVKNDPAKGTIVRHVPSSMSVKEFEALKEYLKTSGNLGEYWRHGELER